MQRRGFSPSRPHLMSKRAATGRWLLLFHQIPPKPDYFRVKVWRRLQRIGAVPVKNSVWVLPYNDQAVEDFRWLLREIEARGGEASVCRGDFVDGLSDRDVEGLFHKARAADYAAIARAAKSLARKVAPIDVARLDHRLAEVTAIDYFHAPNRQKAGRVVAHLEARARRAETRGHPRARAGLLIARTRRPYWGTLQAVSV